MLHIPIDDYNFNHISWPSFDNIHKKFNDGRINDDHNVVMTEKIDGCNFGIEVYVDKIVAIHSRNQSIWNINGDNGGLDYHQMTFNKNKLKFVKDELEIFTNAWKLFVKKRHAVSLETLAEKDSLFLFYKNTFTTNFSLVRG